MEKLSDLLEMAKVSDIIATKKEKEDNKIVWALAIIGAIAAVAGIAFAVYKYLTPDYMDDFDEDFDECYDYEFVENEAVDKFTEYFNEFKSKISELEDDYRILIDYTSGTKTMTMAAAFASMIFRKELFFVSGKREKQAVCFWQCCF